MKLKYTYDEMKNDDSTSKDIIEIDGNINNLHARVCKKIVYTIENGKKLHLRILKPEKVNDTTKYPFILYVQGSAWKRQNMEEHIIDLAPIVLSGYMIGIVEYRDSSIGCFPTQIHDTKTAMRYIETHSDELDVDKHNMFLGGDSSGGHTVLGCWATWYNQCLDVEKTQLPNIRGVIDFYGPTDLYKIGQQLSAIDHISAYSPEGLEIGGYNTQENKEKALNASIHTYLHENMKLAPLLIIHGSKDRLVPFQQSLSLYNIIKGYGYDVTLIKVNGADHGGNVLYCSEVYCYVLDFLKKWSGKL